MRPTLTEQLHGAARVLRDVVAPHVSDANASEQLGHVVAALESAAAGWTGHLPRLLADVAELEALLGPDPAGDPSRLPAEVPDLGAVEARHDALRARLAAEIDRLHTVAATPEVLARRQAVRAQLRRSAERFT